MLQMDVLHTKEDVVGNFYVKVVNGSAYIYEQHSVREGRKVRTPTKYHGSAAGFLSKLANNLPDLIEDELDRKRRLGILAALDKFLGFVGGAATPEERIARAVERAIEAGDKTRQEAIAKLAAARLAYNPDVKPGGDPEDDRLKLNAYHVGRIVQEHQNLGRLAVEAQEKAPEQLSEAEVKSDEPKAEPPPVSEPKTEPSSDTSSGPSGTPGAPAGSDSPSPSKD